jgi:Zn-dependent protease with chaperone function
MPILLVFALIAACLPIDWWEPPFDPPVRVALGLTGGAVSLVLALAFALRTWVVRTLRRDPGRRAAVAHAYGRWRRILFFLNVTTAAACVLAFGWGWFAQHEFVVSWNGADLLAPFAELTVPLPYFAILLGCWLIYYDAERALHRAFHAARPFWPRWAYLLHHLRQFGLMVLLPVVLIVSQQTLERFDEELAHSLAYRVATLAAVPVLLLLMPLLLKPLLGLKPMPPGPVRDRLEALARRLNFRCTDFLLWHTHGAAINAMIAGLLPRARYVVFTDRILEELPPEELDAVFGHEIGHARHGHLWLYAAFLTLSLSTLAALMMFLGQQAKAAGVLEHPEYREWLDRNASWLSLLPVVPVAVVAGYLFVVFGALSRRCERQADVFGCKAVSCGDPGCAGHDEATVFPPGGDCLCPTGIRVFARALARVGDLNGVDVDLRAPRTPLALARGAWAWVRAWQHAPMPRRIAYLVGLIDNPGAERRFQRRLFLFKCGLMLALVAAFVALGQAVGWRDFFDVKNDPGAGSAPPLREGRSLSPPPSTEGGWGDSP